MVAILERGYENPKTKSATISSESVWFGVGHGCGERSAQPTKNK